jgi:hypothetical protein
MTDPREPLWQRMVEEAGAIWCGVQEGSKEGPVIMFQAAQGETTIALYSKALNSVEDVRRAITAKYEEVKAFGDLR